MTLTTKKQIWNIKMFLVLQDLVIILCAIRNTNMLVNITPETEHTIFTLLLTLTSFYT